MEEEQEKLGRAAVQMALGYRVITKEVGGNITLTTSYKNTLSKLITLTPIPTDKNIKEQITHSVVEFCGLINLGHSAILVNIVLLLLDLDKMKEIARRVQVMEATK